MNESIDGVDYKHAIGQHDNTLGDMSGMLECLIHLSLKLDIFIPRD